MIFQNFFIAELESFPAIRRPDTKPNLRPDTEINHRLNSPCSLHFSCTSLLLTLLKTPIYVPQAHGSCIAFPLEYSPKVYQSTEQVYYYA